MNLIKLVFSMFLQHLIDMACPTVIGKLTNVIVPEVYMDYAEEKSIYASRLYKSGIVTTDPRIAGKMKGGGESFQMPFWKTNDVVGATATPVKEDDTLTPDAINAGKMIARRHFREKAFGSNDLAAVLAGSAPMDQFTKWADAFWEKNFNSLLFKSVQGVIANNVDADSSDMVIDLTQNAGDDAKINSDAFIDSVGLFGDSEDKPVAIAMHSKCFTTLQKNGLISTIADQDQNISWDTFMGRKVIQDDSLLVGGTYWSVLFKAGAFAFEQSFDNYVAVEIERDPSVSGGAEILYLRRNFVIHPYGGSWIEGSVAHNFPTDAEIIDKANWDRAVSSVKNMKFSVIKTLG